ncbi:hypothetical protein Ancab_014046 [Ancistrocladus abbreviatus]
MVLGLLCVFQDTDIIEQIDQDVKQTHLVIPFFAGDTQFAQSNQEALKRILMAFAKSNPGVRYVQGMTAILAPLFYVFRNDPDEENASFCKLFNLELSRNTFGGWIRNESIKWQQGPAGRLPKGPKEDCDSASQVPTTELLNDESQVHAEADTFFCFVELLSGFRDNFCQ